MPRLDVSRYVQTSVCMPIPLLWVVPSRPVPGGFGGKRRVCVPSAVRATGTWHGLEYRRHRAALRGDPRARSGLGRGAERVGLRACARRGAHRRRSLLRHLLVACVCLVAHEEGETPRAVLERMFRRAICDEEWRAGLRAPLRLSDGVFPLATAGSARRDGPQTDEARPCRAVRLGCRRDSGADPRPAPVSDHRGDGRVRARRARPRARQAHALSRRRTRAREAGVLRRVGIGIPCATVERAHRPRRRPRARARAGRARRRGRGRPPDAAHGGSGVGRATLARARLRARAEGPKRRAASPRRQPARRALAGAPEPTTGRC